MIKLVGFSATLTKERCFNCCVTEQIRHSSRTPVIAVVTSAVEILADLPQKTKVCMSFMNGEFDLTITKGKHGYFFNISKGPLMVYDSVRENDELTLPYVVRANLKRLL
jgi:hypothetical protein